MIEKKWVCYLLQSLDSNRTYIGATNNLFKRINMHNSGKGAKYTRGQTWMPVLIVKGFINKNSCLSFEKGWQKFYKKRSTNNLNFRYTKDNTWNRVLDLLYFSLNCSLVNCKFKLHNYNFMDYRLSIKIFIDKWIKKLPWPENYLIF